MAIFFFPRILVILRLYLEETKLIVHALSQTYESLTHISHFRKLVNLEIHLSNDVQALTHAPAIVQEAVPRIFKYVVDEKRNYLPYLRFIDEQEQIYPSPTLDYLAITIGGWESLEWPFVPHPKRIHYECWAVENGEPGEVEVSERSLPSMQIATYVVGGGNQD